MEVSKFERLYYTNFHIPNTRYPAFLFILCAFGLLVLNRFDVRPKVTVTILHDTGSTYTIGHTFKQGETIQTTKDEFVEISMGSIGTIALDENTNLELKSLVQNDLRVKFGHGRILTNVTDPEITLRVDTPTAQHKLETSPQPSPSKGEGVRATFIGYDFKRETHVIPFIGSIKTTIPFLNQTFELTNPITIHDVNPPSFENISFDEKTDTRKEFYAWAAQK